MIIHRSDTRGVEDHGWLISRHTFSFADYYNPDRMGFGALRVINDDSVAPGQGFGTHGHRDMEIISIPLSGSLRHQDSMGNAGFIGRGEVQIMSAGSGIRHSEHNASQEESVDFLQIWVLPEKKSITPRYEQSTFNSQDRLNSWQLIVSPDGSEKSLSINQKAWFSLAKLDAESELPYERKSAGSGIYVFILSGNIFIGDQNLSARDGVGILPEEEFAGRGIINSEILLMEVPI